jgi:hypothetical protein
MRARLFTTSPDGQRVRRPRRGATGVRLARRRAEPSPEPAVPAPDSAVERAQHAGGPRDVASYTCGCGYLFVAPVSTTVSCPHCGCDQAW